MERGRRSERWREGGGVRGWREGGGGVRGWREGGGYKGYDEGSEERGVGGLRRQEGHERVR